MADSDHRASLTFICIGIALNHFVLMAVFLMLPQALVQAGVAVGDHGLFYLVVLVLSLVFIAWPLAKDRRGGSTSSAVWPFPLMAIAMILLTTEPTPGCSCSRLFCSLWDLTFLKPATLVEQPCWLVHHVEDW